MVVFVTVIILFVIGVCTYWLYKSEQNRAKYDLLGGPKSLPVIGNLHQLRRDALGFTTQLIQYIKEYGHLKVFRLLLGTNMSFDISGFTTQLIQYIKEYGHLKVFRLLLGTYPLIIICRPEEAEPIMNSSKHIDKSDDYNFLHPWLGTGLLTSTGDKWKTRRRLLTPTFHFKILHDFVGVFNDQSKVLLNKLNKLADGKTFNIFNDITLCALDIICETAMGRSINAQQDQDSEYVQAVYRASDYIFKRMRSPWYWPKPLYDLAGPGKQCEHTLTVLHEFTEKVIRDRRIEFTKLYGKNTTMEMLLERDDTGVGQKKRLAFLDMLLCATSDGESLSFLDIREEVDTFMFEGHDTTAMASNFAVHLIGSDPQVQEKVHAEMDAIFGQDDRGATMDDLKEMKYLECCIKEALRIFPSVPFFGRKLTENCKLGSSIVEKGSTAVVCPMALHRDEKYFPDAEKFDPDRFSSDVTTKRHPYAYMPFSAGARNCIGQKFAILEEKVILSTIFRNFSVKSTQSREEVNPVAELILRPEKGIFVQLTPRSK